MLVKIEQKYLENPTWHVKGHSGEHFLWYLLKLITTGGYKTIKLNLNKYKQVEKGCPNFGEFAIKQ